MGKLVKDFAAMVFNDAVMREKLPRDVYLSLKKTIRDGADLDINLANAVAHAMKEWAIEKGATHYTHWFQPLTGVTAEKHDSFLRPAKDGDGESAIEQFSGKRLIKGEPDASSFPSGGLRATFEARGYTAWDPTSYAFIKEKTLYIPTAFCSYGGEMLDKKTPLLRSLEALSAQATRVLRLLGMKDVGGVTVNVGAEQEYFLVDSSLVARREDLRFCGCTLFGAPAPKGQELDDHYFGVIRPRVKEFTEDLNEELWRLGVFSSTEHNEAAPSQHELAPIYTVCNRAADQNQLTMELLKKVADRHGLTCLLHEKPFRGVNGSGKHNNWSLFTDTGVNLFAPGDDPASNTVFLLFLSAVLTAVDEYGDLLRISVASPGNDKRLGGEEAPPAILSVYLGDELTGILDCVESGKKYAGGGRTQMQTGVHVLPDFKKDTTDRNRTSPFAFTGNKFEFRMPGSAQSISDVNTTLNAAVAAVLRRFGDKLENKKEPEAAARRIVRAAYSAHKRIVFNGNNYSAEWVKEAEKRGLPNYASSADAFPHFTAEKNLRLFVDQGIFSEAEICSRREIMLENYVKVISIEASVMTDMAVTQILPALRAHLKELFETLKNAQTLDVRLPGTDADARRLAALAEEIGARAAELENGRASLARLQSPEGSARFCRDGILPAMAALRDVCDRAERLAPAAVWPMPTYKDLLFSV
ncbi:MAG: glutamine synthetase III [Clostridia bacterium]|nr:glutamine synthetase III [Clostridia bacterium]